MKQMTYRATWLQGHVSDGTLMNYRQRHAQFSCETRHNLLAENPESFLTWLYYYYVVD